jgi:hypothetical protein
MGGTCSVRLESAVNCTSGWSPCLADLVLLAARLGLPLSKLGIAQESAGDWAEDGYNLELQWATKDCKHCKALNRKQLKQLAEKALLKQQPFSAV